MMNCRRGDVVLTAFPDSNLRTYKKRPVLIVQADSLNTGLSQRIVAMITSNLKRTGQTRVLFAKGSPAGQRMRLLSDSVVVTDNLQTVLDREIHKVIGSCPEMPRVDQALRVTLGL